MAHAMTSDVAVELGRPSSSSEETAQWGAWLERVERTIKRGFRLAGTTLADEIALGVVATDDVRDVEVAAVVRKIQNPTWGETSVTRSVDDAAVTARREGAGKGDPLDLLEWEWSALLPGSDSGAFSTRPGFETDRSLIGPWGPFT